MSEPLEVGEERTIEAERLIETASKVQIFKRHGSTQPMEVIRKDLVKNLDAEDTVKVSGTRYFVARNKGNLRITVKQTEEGKDITVK